ncbi:hypothetical protein HY490_00730 [Candidatus Woesearchaeota archaeon]|nr:hypothetical protein [Candidatus Woesearchaeota archaeon]
MPSLELLWQKLECEPVWFRSADIEYCNRLASIVRGLGEIVEDAGSKPEFVDEVVAFVRTAEDDYDGVALALNSLGKYWREKDPLQASDAKKAGRYSARALQELPETPKAETVGEVLIGLYHAYACKHTLFPDQKRGDARTYAETVMTYFRHIQNSEHYALRIVDLVQTGIQQADGNGMSLQLTQDFATIIQWCTAKYTYLHVNRPEAARYLQGLKRREKSLQSELRGNRSRRRP